MWECMWRGFSEKTRLQSTLGLNFKAASLKTFGRPSCIGYLRQMEDTVLHDLRQGARE